MPARMTPKAMAFVRARRQTPLEAVPSSPRRIVPHRHVASFRSSATETVLRASDQAWRYRHAGHNAARMGFSEAPSCVSNASFRRISSRYKASSLSPRGARTLPLGTHWRPFQPRPEGLWPLLPAASVRSSASSGRLRPSDRAWRQAKGVTARLAELVQRVPGSITCQVFAGG